MEALGQFKTILNSSEDERAVNRQSGYCTGDCRGADTAKIRPQRKHSVPSQILSASILRIESFSKSFSIFPSSELLDVHLRYRIHVEI